MPYKDKERKRAYAQRPENKERQRAYAQRPENKERKRAYRSDLKCIMKRCELDASGIAAIVAAARAGDRYIDIANDWLIAEPDVGAIAKAHGIERRKRKLLPPAGEVRP